MKELTDKITEYEAEVKDLIAQADAAAPPTPSTSEGGDPADTDASDDETDDEFEDRFVDLEEDLANVIADVHDLGESSWDERRGSSELIRFSQATSLTSTTLDSSRLSRSTYVEILRPESTPCTSTAR